MLPTTANTTKSASEISEKNLTAYSAILYSALHHRELLFHKWTSLICLAKYAVSAGWLVGCLVVHRNTHTYIISTESCLYRWNLFFSLSSSNHVCVAVCSAVFNFPPSWVFKCLQTVVVVIFVHNSCANVKLACWVDSLSQRCELFRWKYQQEPKEQCCSTFLSDYSSGLR